MCRVWGGLVSCLSVCLSEWFQIHGHTHTHTNVVPHFATLTHMIHTDTPSIHRSIHPPSHPSIHPQGSLVGRCIYARWLTACVGASSVCLSCPVLSCLVLSWLRGFLRQLTHSLTHCLPACFLCLLPPLARMDGCVAGWGVVGCISTCQRATQVFVCACVRVGFVAWVVS